MVKISLNNAFKSVNKDIITSPSKTHVVEKIGIITAMGQTHLTVLHGDVVIIQLHFKKWLLDFQDKPCFVLLDQLITTLTFRLDELSVLYTAIMSMTMSRILVKNHLYIDAFSCIWYKSTLECIQLIDSLVNIFVINTTVW